MADATPSMVRVGEQGGGDYMLRVVDETWRVSHWIPGKGRKEFGRGDAFADGPVKLIQCLADHWLLRYAEAARDVWLCDRLPTTAVLRPGFRPGAHKKQASKARAEWARKVPHWFDTADRFLTSAEAAGWPTQHALTMQWLELTIPKHIAPWKDSV